MQETLRHITSLPGIRGAIVFAPDGLVVASELADEMDANALAAVASEVFSALEGVCQRLERGGLERFVINGSRASLVLFHLGNAILLTLVRKGANMGMVLVELKESVDRLREHLG